ncbi:MAG TPA: hypothetical protein P5567_12495 [Kiritimatiellia bacterium]|nr:hypothetical protein [Kiritimatiellia bacterium]HRZ13260.1 hypothetical protein [Kiritimatiellia bacterium]HSA18709.1 hypothetical protein [Kiritimatiellia bacterium]
MKQSGWLAGWIGLSLACAASGQVEVGCRLEASRALLFEPVRVTVRVTNNSGHPLHFGGSSPDARLGFSIEQAPGEPVLTTGQPLLAAPLDLAPGASREVTINLLPSYRIHATGPYTIQARVDLGDEAYVSQKAYLDVLPGFEVGRLAVGLAGASKDTRIYTIKTLTRDRMELLFLRVDDDKSGRCLGVFDLGRIVRQFQPQMAGDSRGHVHVLHQSSPWKFTHTEINPDGIPVAARDFSAYSTEVRLEKEPDGSVIVRGVRPAPDPSLFQPPATLTPEPAGGKKRR